MRRESAVTPEQLAQWEHLMTDPAGLISVLEATFAGFRRLDAAIAEAIGNKVTWRPDGFFLDATLEPCPQYTTSLDAALTLVPPDRDFCVGTLNETERSQVFVPSRADAVKPPPAGRYCTAMVGEEADDWRFNHDWEDIRGSGCVGATPALALCIAALRAMAESPPVERPKPDDEPRAEHPDAQRE